MNRTAVLLLTLAAVIGCRRRVPPPEAERVAEGLQPPQPPPPPTAQAAAAKRCAPAPDRHPFVLSASTGAAAKDGETAVDVAVAGDAEDRTASLPFAAETGLGVAWSEGFAVGAIHAPQGSPLLAIVTLGPEGERPAIVSLGPARGDVEPPRLASHGDTLFFGVLQAGSMGRTLRLGTVRAAHVAWGATLQSRAGESQAFDLAAGAAGDRVVVAWDEERADISVIQLASVDTANLGTASATRTVSPPGRDADSPRLLARPGGYWLAWIAHRAAPTNADAAYVPEEIGYRWIELVPLDAAGTPTGRPREVSPTDGHVMVFDLGPAADGGALVVWRELDTPTGSAGGKIMRALARADSADPPAVLVDSDVGAGAPALWGQWLAVADAADVTRLGWVSVTGELLAPLIAEPDIGTGEPVAARENALLISRPLGRSTRLSVVHCQPPSH